jgi:uncharacterized protein (TIGR00299 family) protein
MIIAALLDLGVPRQVLDDAVAALALPGVSIDAQKVWVGAIYATRFTVNVEGVQHERRYSEIVELLRQAHLDEDVRVRAQSVFLRLARAEGRVHGVPLEEVHFHEVGAADAIVDIIGAAALLSYLGARLLCSPLPLGHGWVNTRHGVLPVPAPATLLCLEGMATIDGGVEGELTTPTGAAIVAALGVSAEAWPSARPLAVGWGAGHRELRDRPNALRVVLCEPSAPTDVAATHEVLSCNVDDMTGEELGHAIARLIDQGALDAWASPIVMKKGRPAWCVSALGTRADAARLALLLLEHSTSLGVRRTPVSRIELGRRIVHVSTRYGQVPVKVAEMSGRERGKPEFDVCAQLSARHGVAVRDVVEAALEALRSELGRAGE